MHLSAFVVQFVNSSCLYRSYLRLFCLTVFRLPSHHCQQASSYTNVEGAVIDRSLVTYRGTGYNPCLLTLRTNHIAKKFMIKFTSLRTGYCGDSSKLEIFYDRHASGTAAVSLQA